MRRTPTGEGEWPAAKITDFCGEWADKTITPEQERRRELVRRLAVALFTSDRDCMVHELWQMAATMADWEPPKGG